jgi:hypothetical protein
MEKEYISNIHHPIVHEEHPVLMKSEMLLNAHYGGARPVSAIYDPTI